jgi:hypothetical protein
VLSIPPLDVCHGNKLALWALVWLCAVNVVKELLFCSPNTQLHLKLSQLLCFGVSWLNLPPALVNEQLASTEVAE